MYRLHMHNCAWNELGDQLMGKLFSMYHLYVCADKCASVGI